MTSVEKNGKRVEIKGELLILRARRIRNYVGAFSAFVGAMIVLSETGIAIRERSDPSLTTVLIGIFLVFVGGYLIIPREVEQIADSVTEHSVPIITAIRGGQRNYDPPLLDPKVVEQERGEEIP